MCMRLPYLPKDQVDAPRQALYDAFIANVAENFGQVVTTKVDGSLVGPWGIWMQVPTVGEPFLELIRNVREMSGLSSRAQQVVILVVGATYRSAYEMYAHSRVALDAGLSDQQIGALLSGHRPGDLTGDEVVAADIAYALVGGGILPRPLYDRGLAELGQEGLNKVIFTVAQYTFVAVMLNAFDVPDETGEPTEPASTAKR